MTGAKRIFNKAIDIFVQLYYTQSVVSGGDSACQRETISVLPRGLKICIIICGKKDGSFELSFHFSFFVLGRKVMTDIKTMRKAAKLTQKEMSDLLNIPKRTIENWEAGKRIPPSYVVDLIEFYLKQNDYIK